MENNNSRGDVQKPIWKRRGIRYLVSSAAIALLIFLAFEGISLFWPHPAAGNLVSFVCSPSSSDQAFIVSARINLSDGMDQDEAMEVANKVFLGISQQPIDRSIGQSAPQLLNTRIKCDEKGIWTVEFIFVIPLREANRAYGGSEAIPRVHKTYAITINPFDQTVRKGSSNLTKA